MAQYVVCDKCGANLDFGEKCDCEIKNEDALTNQRHPQKILKNSINHSRKFVKKNLIKGVF